MSWVKDALALEKNENLRKENEKYKSGILPCADRLPYGNTGVQNTGLEQIDIFEVMSCCHNGMYVSLDWLDFTIHIDDPFFVIISCLDLPLSDFVLLEKGGLGYKKCLKWAFGNVRVFYEGNENMGCHVVITGDGCRSLFSHISPKKLLQSVIENKGNFTRVDVAFDDLGANFYTVPALREELLSGNIISFWRFATLNSEVFISSPFDITKDILYFGSMKSECYLRVYDKQKETNIKREEGKELFDKSWVRWEIVFRKGRANALIRELCSCDFALGTVFIGVLSYYFRIVTDNGDKNKSRWPTSELWQEFLAGVSKLRLVVLKAERTLDTIKDWIKRQVMPSLCTVFLAENSPIWIFDEILKSKYRLSSSHNKIISDYRYEMGFSI